MQQMLLLADDSARSRQLELDLKSAFPGLRLLVATTCSEARCLIAYHAPAVMVMDCPRPSGCGKALQQELQATIHRLSTIAIISNEWTPAQREEISEHNVYRMLCEPLDTQELIQVIEQSLTVSGESTSSIRRIQTPLAAGLSAIPGRGSFQRHRVVNRLASLLAGIRAFGADLRVEAKSTQSVRSIASQYEEHLTTIVKELSKLLGQSPQAPSDHWQKGRR